ncbi:MAG: FmdB family transcriptional regulator [Phycisphaerales bacterium]|nr:MAG: FmdB family transcriptional regulator [Phycisphaerales bacterium]
MPLYDYDILDAKGEPTGERVEVFQSMKDAPLTKHPETGKPIRRAIVAPNLNTRGDILSNKNLDRLGFTKYEKKGKGHMERTAGKEGPRSVSLDD